MKKNHRNPEELHISSARRMMFDANYLNQGKCVGIRIDTSGCCEVAMDYFNCLGVMPYFFLKAMLKC